MSPVIQEPKKLFDPVAIMAQNVSLTVEISRAYR